MGGLTQLCGTTVLQCLSQEREPLTFTCRLQIKHMLMLRDPQDACWWSVLYWWQHALCYTHACMQTEVGLDKVAILDLSIFTMIFSKCFITTDVKATGLKSLFADGQVVDQRLLENKSLCSS